MPRLLIVVSDLFDLEDRILLAPPVPFSVIGAEDSELAPGADLELRRPDGTTFKTKLYCLEPSSRMDGLFMGLSKPIAKDDVPLGTEIWMAA